MKILRLSSYDSPAKGLMLIADSAWRPDRRPYFVPARESECELRAAVRISRLGKTIAPKFAHRYYDALCIVWLTRPADAAEDTPATAAADDTLVAGGIIPVADLPATIRIERPARAEYILEPNPDKIDKLISELSQEMTFKTGDLILLPDIIAKFKPEPDTVCRVMCNDNDRPILEFNIK